MGKIGIYPGTFDPITYGHTDIICKALNVVDRLIIAVAENNTKSPIFSAAERKAMIEQEIEPLKQKGAQVEVESFNGLLVDFASQKNASLIIRGLRAISDFEYEFQMSCMNAHLASKIQTIFLPASERTHFISSKLVKEVARLNGNVSEVVSENVKSKLLAHYNHS